MHVQAITWVVPSSALNLPDAIGLLVAELDRAGVSPEAWLLGAARLLPSVIFIPAFGLRALALPARLLFAFVLAASTGTAFVPGAPLDRPWPSAIFAEVVHGLPVAVSAATTIWSASMAGNLADELRGGPAPSDFPTSDSPSGPLGILLSLAASLAFLEFGGPALLAQALAAAPPVSLVSVTSVVRGLVAGVELAVLIAAPLLVVLLFFEVFRALLGRATNASLWAPLLAPVRALSVLAIVALLLDRLVEGVALWMRSSLSLSGI
jgi:type III secretory pathway component EscT